MKTVYTIIFFEQSSAEFKAPDLNGAYLHQGKTTFNTGLQLDLLQQFYLISLDVFSENKYPLDKNNRLTAWLSLLATRDTQDLDTILAAYPWLEEIYQDMASYLRKPEEVLTMFSDALKILDHNTVQYMIDEMQNTIDGQKAEIADKDSQLANKDSQLANKDSQLANQAIEIADQAAEIAALKAQLAAQQK